MRFPELRAATALALLLFLLFASSSEGQGVTETRALIALDEASRLVGAGHYDEAIKRLTQLDRDYPNRRDILDLLRRAYMYSADFPSALAVIGRIEKLDGPSPDISIQYGDLYLRMGKPDEAAREFGKALKGGRTDIHVYPMIAGAYRANGLYDMAVKTYLDARSKTDNPNMFSRELGQLYEVQRNYPAAVEEYFNFMQSDTISEQMGDQNIRNVIESIDDAVDFALLKNAFERLSRSHKDSYAPRRYLADILIGQDSLQRAFEAYKEVDQLEGDQGRFLVYFAQKCFDKEEYRLSADVCNYVLEKYPGKPHFIQALFLLSSAYASLGKGDSAIVVLNQIADRTPDPRDIQEAYYCIGEVFLLTKRDPDSALVYYEKVFEDSWRSGWHHRGRLRTADCHLARGEAALADSLYAEVDAAKLPEGDQERLAWRMAEVKFFEHSFDEAKRLYASLTVKFRRGLYVNDCLKRILMINENTEFDRIELDSYADAEFLIVQGKSDSAESVFRSISEKSGAKLSDIATYRLGELYLLRGESEAALSTFERLLSDFPDSFWRGESQKEIADIYWQRGDIPKAQEAYQRLLTGYQSVILQDHARERLRQIEHL